MSGEEVREPDNEHDGSVFHIDNEIVSDLRHNIPECLRENYIDHGLHMCHSNRLGAFRLAGIHRDNASSYRLCHVGSRVDGHDYNRCSPDGSEFYRVICKIGQPIIQEHSLEHHRRAAEYLNVNSDNHTDQRKEKSFHRVVIATIGNCIENSANKPDQAADYRADQCKNQCVFYAAKIGIPVFQPKLCDIRTKLSKFVHRVALPLFFLIKNRGKRGSFPSRLCCLSGSLHFS